MAKAIKASDKQAICRKLMTAFKKRYGGSAPKKENRPVLETMLFACLLEDAEYQAAVDAYDKLLGSFHDLNEIRVSSITEVETVLKGLERPEWKALHVRSCLQYVFEKKYEFEFEGIKRKTMDLATRNLAKIPNISPFIQAYTLHHCLGGHIVPLDTSMTNAAIFLGFATPEMDTANAIEAIKPALKKPDVDAFCNMFRQFSRDPKLRAVFDGAAETAAEGGNNLLEAPSRLNELFKSPAKFKPKKKKAAPKLAAEEKPARQKKAAKKAEVKKKAARKKAVKKKAVKKKAVKKKTVKKKATGKKTASKKTTKKKVVKKAVKKKKKK